MRREENSRLMKVFNFLHMKKLYWKARRFHTPVASNELVLEVGAGGNPYPRANILLDAYEETRERHWVPLIQDRPTVLGYVENLPFKDKSFDFVIAAHVLEHSTDPVKFLTELQRVAKSGYIEVPSAFMERINPYKDHRLEISCKGNKLVLFKKSNWVEDSYLVDLYEGNIKEIITKQTIPNNPLDFHVRYYWNNKIDFEVLNPNTDANWLAPPSIAGYQRVKPSIKNKLNFFLQGIVRSLFSQSRRNKSINVEELLRCPKCKSENISNVQSKVICQECSTIFSTRGNLIDMINYNEN